MKKSPSHCKKNFLQRSAWTLLAFLLVISTLTLPALAAESDLPPEESGISSEALDTNDSETDEPGGPQPSLQPEKSGESDPSAEATPSPEPTSTPQPKTYKIVFSMGSLGTKEYQVEAGQYLSEMPDEPYLPAAVFTGWYDEKGQPVQYPDSVPAERDIVYTARFYRNVTEFLNTTSHTPYVGGYENGMFRANANISRAEATQMIYGLLQSTDFEPKIFSDVKSSAWYYEPVGVAAQLGVVQGYADGTFLPTHKITRAEFVKMVVSCDSLIDAPVSFEDVPASSWAAPYIATATERGWIDGYPDGTFKPNDKITRAQAIAILNRVLGRIPSDNLKATPNVKNFYDLFPEHWAYSHIVEAATDHTYTISEGKEVWTEYEKDLSVVEKSHWLNDASDKYYLDAKTRKFLRGEATIDGRKYLFDSTSGKAFTGFRPIGNFTRYYKDGLMLEDISGLGVVTGPYFIKVYKPANYLIIFAKDSKGEYTVPVRAMLVSCGYGTPTGTYYTPDRYRWLQMVGDTFAQWCTQIFGNYLFHSVPNWTYNNFDLEVDEYNHLGDTRSLGCIRLNCRDAKWIYDNCVLGTKVFISAIETYGPLPKPKGLKIPSWHTWDPTDPTAYFRCRQVGCH